MTRPTRLEICSDITLWNEYVNPDGAMSDEEFESLTIDRRLSIMDYCFGEEECSKRDSHLKESQHD